MGWLSSRAGSLRTSPRDSAGAVFVPFRLRVLPERPEASWRPPERNAVLPPAPGHLDGTSALRAIPVESKDSPARVPIYPLRGPRGPLRPWADLAMRALGVLACVCLSPLVACSPQVQTIPFDDGSVFEQSHWAGGLLHGEFRQFHPNAQLERAGQYSEGLPDGEWLSWYENGQQETREEYVKGVRTGLWTEWYASGDKRAEGHWVDGDRDGLWEHWSPDGEPGSEALWERGTRISVRYFQ